MAFVPPSQFAANRIQSGESLCDALAKVFRQVNLVAEQSSFEWTEAGEFTVEYKAKLCATGCAGGGGDTSTSTPDPSGVATAYLANRFLSGGGVFRGRLFSIEAGGWTYSTINGDMAQVLVGMAVRPSDSTLWAIYIDSTNDANPFPLRLGTVNTTTGAVTYVATINSGGSDWSQNGVEDYYCLEFKPDGTLLLGSVDGSVNIYTVNTATGEAAAIGTQVLMVGTANSFYPWSLSYNSAGVLHAMGINGSTNSIISATVNLTPNPAAGNAIEATEACEILALGALPPPTQRIYNGLLNKNSKRQTVVRGTADIYEITDAAGACINPFVLKMNGATSMTGVTSMAGVPS